MWLFFSKCLVEFFERFKKSRTIEDYFFQVKVDLHITPRRPNMEKCRCIERYRSWSALQAACSFSFRWYDTASSDKGIESPRNGFAHGAYRLYGKKKKFSMQSILIAINSRLSMRDEFFKRPRFFFHILKVLWAIDGSAELAVDCRKLRKSATFRVSLKKKREVISKARGNHKSWSRACN